MVELISQKKGRDSSTNQTNLRNLGLFELYNDKVKSNMLLGNLAAWVTTHIGIGRRSFDPHSCGWPAISRVWGSSRVDRSNHLTHIWWANLPRSPRFCAHLPATYPRFHPCSDKQEAVKQRQGKLRKPVTWLIGSLTWLQMGPWYDMVNQLW